MVLLLVLAVFYPVCLWGDEKRVPDENSLVGAAQPDVAKGEDVAKAETAAKREVVYPAKTKDSYKVDPKWKLIWSDEFEGDELNLKNWTRQVLPKPYNEEWQQYFDREENSFVKDGYLVIKAIHTSDVHADKQYTSGRLHTGGKHSWKYGKIAARIQLPHGRGIWPAFWMLGDDVTEIGGKTPWPKCGEIDILELYGTKDDAVVEANLHYDDNGHEHVGAASFKLKQGIFADNFHVFEIEWTKEKMTWLVDGHAYHSVDITAEVMSEFHANQYILLNIAVGGTHAGRPDQTTPFPAQMYVDWVRVYQ